MAQRTFKQPAKLARKAAPKRAAAKPALLAGGNPQIAKAEGDAPVQAYIAAMPDWKRDIGSASVAAAPSSESACEGRWRNRGPVRKGVGLVGELRKSNSLTRLPRRGA